MTGGIEVRAADLHVDDVRSIFLHLGGFLHHDTDAGKGEHLHTLRSFKHIHSPFHHFCVGFCKISQFFLFLLGGVIINRRGNICKMNKVDNKNRKQRYLRADLEDAAAVSCCAQYEERRKNGDGFPVFFYKKRETFVLCCCFKKVEFFCDADPKGVFSGRTEAEYRLRI